MPTSVGHPGPTTFPIDETENIESASALAAVRNRRIGTTRAPYNLRPPTGNPTRLREPSPAQYWRTSPAILDEATDDEEDELHFTLKKSIDPSKFTHLFCIKPQLNSTNYAIWSSAVLRALQTVSLHVYLNSDFTMPSGITLSTQHHPVRWRKANLFVCSVLTAAMTEERQHKVGYLPTAAEIWAEARRLYMGATATDWTLTITALVSTRYKDVMAHITKMKIYRRDLLIMQRDIDDGLFACFLRISMPSSWNYIFAALPDQYTSAEVERRIRDEYGVRTSQTKSNSNTFQAVCSRKSKSGLSRMPIEGQPYCDNRQISGHNTKDCYSPGGPMHGKRRGKKPTEEKEEDADGQRGQTQEQKPNSSRDPTNSHHQHSRRFGQVQAVEYAKYSPQRLPDRSRHIGREYDNARSANS